MANLHIKVALHTDDELFELQEERLEGIRECIHEADKVFIYYGELKRINEEIKRRLTK